MLLKDAWIDAPHRHRRLTLFSLMVPEGRTLPYPLMSEVLESGTLRIDEVNERGSVPKLIRCGGGRLWQIRWAREPALRDPPNGAPELVAVPLRDLQSRFTPPNHSPTAICKQCRRLPDAQG